MNNLENQAAKTAAIPPRNIIFDISIFNERKWVRL
jgi:hypothetical protein